MPECAIVCSILLCVKTNETMGGTINSTEDAAATPVLEIAATVIWLNAVGKSFRGSLQITPAEPVFQIAIKVKTITVIQAGLMLGSTTW